MPTGLRSGTAISGYLTFITARQLDVALVQAAMDELAPRQIFSAGPCACGATGLRYGW
jgi:hypothetical protein